MSNLNLSIVSKIEVGNLLENQGKPQEALEIYLSTWKDMDALKPEKHQTEEARWLINCIYEMHIQLGDYQTAKKWAEDIFKCNIPDAGTSELIDLGKIHFELGEEDKSLNFF